MATSVRKGAVAWFLEKRGRGNADHVSQTISPYEITSSHSDVGLMSSSLSFILGASSEREVFIVSSPSTEIDAPWAGVPGLGTRGLLINMCTSWGFVSKKRLWSGTPTFSACFLPTAIAHPVCLGRTFDFEIPPRRPRALLCGTNGFRMNSSPSISRVRGSESKWL